MHETAHESVALKQNVLKHVLQHGSKKRTQNFNHRQKSPFTNKQKKKPSTEANQLTSQMK